MATYTIDAAHSEVTFKVKHLVISTVSGNFSKFDGKLESSKDDFSDASVFFEADVNSISTGNEQRDGHLKNADFFDAETFPKISFTSTSIDKKNDNEYALHGDLTIRDVTKNVSLSVEHGGIMVDPWGQTKAGFELNGKISRKEFGLVLNPITETGGVVIGDDVRLHINIELTKQA